jgi:mono/diheme cytochrome c family protein
MRRRKTLLALGATTLLGLVVAVVLYRVADAPSDSSETPQADTRPDAAMIARGAYLAAASDCVSCHTLPGKPPYSGGPEFKLPFGTLYGSNITPDLKYGIGSWSDSDFIAAMHRGIAKDGRHLYPAFPYTNYTKMPVSDVLAIKAYLFSLKPAPIPSVKNKILFPFNQTWGIAYWNLLFNPNRRFEPDPRRSAQVNRGAYLVEGPGHCPLCHSPLNLAFVPEKDREMAGAVVEGVRCYNISSDAKWGVGSWSVAELANYLKTGYSDDRGAAGTSMGQVVENSTSQMSDADLAAMAAYLKQLEPQPGVVEITRHSAGAEPDSLQTFAGELDGRRIYEGACMGCHGSGGSASAHAGTLQGHPTVNDKSSLNATWVTLHGVDYWTAEGHIYMPAFAGAYSDAEIASVVRYVEAAFGPGGAKVNGNTVERARSYSP